MTDRELFKMALDALECWQRNEDCNEPMSNILEALRTALAQPEPVIQARKEGDLIVIDLPQVSTGGGGISKEEQHKPMHPAIKKMYEDYFDKHFEETSKKREQWVGLTDEELEFYTEELGHGELGRGVLRAVVDFLKGKNT